MSWDKKKRPTREEIDVYGCLDGKHAAKQFLGKDIDQAKAMFRENFLFYQEDLMWMGPIAFCFYIEAAIDYLLSAEADEDSDAANCFLGAVEFQRKNDSAGIAPAYPRLREAIATMLKDFDRYGCNLEIYGDLKSRYEKLLDKLH